ncbi:MAG: redoxin domain-containing protein [Nitrospirae bacterium]|nr:redoxin domain-containing protein [Nitrospirota bacterium]MBI3594206.1 redoxin domain-containing protein [Nitrospirota bacterium]
MNENSGGLRVWHIVLLSVILGLLILFYKGLYGNPSFIPPVLVGTPAPRFEAPDLYKKERVTLDQFRGKVVVLNFWSSWCQECKLEHESLQSLNRQYGQNAQFVLLGVDYQDKEDLAKDYLQQYGNNFQHIIDTQGRISIDYGVYGVPETFVIDQSGIIRHKEIGPLVGETYIKFTREVIEPLLKEKS